MKGFWGIAFLLFMPTVGLTAESPATRTYEEASWSPYLVGTLLGMLTWLTFYFSDKPVGASSFYATLAGKIGMLLAPGHTKSLAYYQENPPRFGWETYFVLATVLGSFIAAFSGGQFHNVWVPAFWVDKFGEASLPSRAWTCIGGGILMAFGARWAGGCTSGHGISGTAQLNLASWMAVICFFIGGVLLAHLIFKI